MAVTVNPPPQLKIPRAFLKDPEVREFIKQQNTIIFQLYQRSGGATDTIEIITEDIGINLLSRIEQLADVLDGLPELTIDTTGFTADITLITTDKVIA